MSGTNQSIVVRQLFAPPVSPAPPRGCGLPSGLELLRPCHQPIGLAECMDRHGVSRQVRGRRLSLEQGATAEQTAFAVASRLGENDLARCGGEDGLEVATVCGVDR